VRWVLTKYQTNAFLNHVRWLFVCVLRLYLIKPAQIQAGLPNNSSKPIPNASTSVVTGIFTGILTRLLTGANPGALTGGIARNPNIYTGLKHGWHDLHAIRTGFKVVPFKTHANASKSCKQLLKSHPNCINKLRSREEDKCKFS
jgi:hypothetical protein